MIVQPDYFEPIRATAAKRWEQLDRDPELAGPWHLLFEQVQSPRHVLSELLQNADDAGASEASVRVEDGAFIFAHNGGDFIEEHFASLCRFGYSNKRALHTIGFRGIGFKSTFSLGDRVELYTPTLSVGFHRKRFTEPQWIPGGAAVRLTEVRVRIRDQRREEDIRRNLDDWMQSPLSLLFFKNIRKLQVGDEELYWKDLGPGLVEDSRWMALNGNADERFLLVRSAAETFPEDALVEIREARRVGDDQLSDFPPCTVEIVFGSKGQLFVVLPTGVETALPFACNAPFLQDPSRLKIKEPAESPTNRWLLDRIGKLGASVMLQWLGQDHLAASERSRAYGMFPDVNREDNSLEGTCGTFVEMAFGEAIAGKQLLLTEGGGLAGANEAVTVPGDLLEVWSAEQISAFLDQKNRPILSQYVSYKDAEKLVDWDLIQRLGKQDVLTCLQSKHLKKPETWRRLLKLWAYIAPDVTGYNWQIKKEALRIVPVQGKDVLYAAKEVVRLGEKRLLQSDSDWEFLSEHLVVLNQNWPRWLAEQRRCLEEGGGDGAKVEVAAGLAVLNAIGLNDASDVSSVIEQVAAVFFKQAEVPLGGCVQLAQIAAKLGATAGTSFRFATQDRHLHGTDRAVVSDPNGALEALLPSDWCAAHLLHSEYQSSFKSCTKEEWLRWISTGRAGLLGFAPLVQKRSAIWSKRNLEAELGRRGYGETPAYAYVTSHFIIEDWDFEEIHWRHWEAGSKDDANIWGRIADRLLSEPGSFWAKAKSARALHVATTGSTRSIVSGPILPSWILRLRELPCLADTHGFCRKPEALLMRTPETEPLLDVEPFVNARLDREAARPLLHLLGVRDTPMGPGRLLDCLRALSKTEKPPIHEVEKWYRRLDQLVESCSTDDLTRIRNAFRDERIVLTENVVWTTASGAFLTLGDDDVPGAEIIRRSVQDLALWGKVGVAERPTIELAIRWLRQLPSGAGLSQTDLRRVKSLLARHAIRIWNECGHWLNLCAEWAPVSTIAYNLSMQSLTRWSHLYDSVKQKTADLTYLSAELTEVAPFSDIPSLASHIEDRFNASPRLSGAPNQPAWLKQLGIELQRIELDDEDDAVEIWALGAQLADTFWQVSDELDLVPYIDGAPAGLPRSAEVVWREKLLYVKDLPHARLARPVSLELGRLFRRSEIGDAVKLCFDRPAEFVTEYMEENFKLSPAEAIAEQTIVTTPAETQNGAGKPSAISSPPTAFPPEGEIGTPSVALSGEMPGDGPESKVEGVMDGAQPEQPSSSTSKPHHERPARPARLSIIERFARANGFEKDSENRFFHVDGSWIERPHGERFWERRTGNGDLIRYYWPKEHCLQNEPLQLEADIWGLIDKNPDIYALVLADVHERAVEITGSCLKTMCSTGEIKLYPATYRLVYQDAVEL